MGLDRDKRLSRRQEEHDFRRIYQPVSLFFGAVGVLLIGWVGLSYDDGQQKQTDLIGAGIILLAFPVLVFLLRLLRGHFRKDVRS
ncbi:MAG: hypothetical protein ACEQSM_03230 [Aliarcobacter sp.]